jgi:hypothetical protein
MENLQPVIDAFLSYSPGYPAAAAVILLIVDQLKRYGLKDGWAGTVSLGLEFALWLVVSVATAYGQGEQATSVIDVVITSAKVIIPALASFGIGDILYNYLKSRQIVKVHEKKTTGPQG